MEKRNNDLAWRTGGPQGSGVVTAATLFSRTCAVGGLNVFSRREYYSNIMGRHSYLDVRVGAKQPTCHRENVDMLVSFDAETIVRHATSVVPGGVILYGDDHPKTKLSRITYLDERLHRDLARDFESKGLDMTVESVIVGARDRGVTTRPVPFKKIIATLADRCGVLHSTAARTQNTQVVALSMDLFEFDFDVLTQTLENMWAGRQSILDLNIEAVNVTREFVEAELRNFHVPVSLSPIADAEPCILVNGNESVAMGKIAGGMTFQSYYPISPATAESVYLEGNTTFPTESGEEGSVVVVQMEDEIAAVAMAAGAALTGARAATATSGPGFCLMSEAVGWAGNNEVPLVITLYQRGGPSTGLPTRSEQGDLWFSIFAGHSEVPRLVIASGDLQEGFDDAIRAFNYAERYQTVVIHLVDKHFASSSATTVPFEATRKIDRGLVFKPAEGVTPMAKGESFSRFAVTENGISPRALHGTPNGMHWLTGCEHTELGRVVEDPVVREAQMEKRMRKLETASSEIPLDDKLSVYGDPDAGLTILGWGTSKGAVTEAIDRLAVDGISARYVHVKLLWPFPTDEIESILSTATKVVDIELNHGSQLAVLLRQQSGRECDHCIVKYNGRPYSGETLYKHLREIHEGECADQRIIVRNSWE